MAMEKFLKHMKESVGKFVRNKKDSNIITGRSPKRIRDWQQNSGFSLLHYSAKISGIYSPSTDIT